MQMRMRNWLKNQPITSNFANFSNNCLVPTFSNCTVALVLSPVPSMLRILPCPKRLWRMQTPSFSPSAIWDETLGDEDVVRETDDKGLTVAVLAEGIGLDEETGLADDTAGRKGRGKSCRSLPPKVCFRCQGSSTSSSMLRREEMMLCCRSKYVGSMSFRNRLGAENSIFP